MADDDAAPLRQAGWELRLLGGFALTGAGGEPMPPIAPRLRLLLASLALFPGEEQGREGLASRLWPESDQEQARTNLRKAWHELRRRLPQAERLVDAAGETLTWRADAPCRVDAVEFRRSAEGRTVEELVRAAGLYRGDFLPDHWEEWVLSRREELRHQYLGVLERLAALMESRGQYREAQRRVRQLLAEDPLREEHWRRLLRLAGLQHDRAALEHAWRECGEWLRRELAVAPSEATRRAYEAAREEAERPAVRTAGTARWEELLEGVEEELFVGREALREWFATWLTTDAPPALLAVHGPGGVGKSALLRAFARQAARQGWAVRVLDARDVPDVLRALGRALGRGQGRRLVLLDTCEAAPGLGRHLAEHLLPRLEQGARLVGAGRFPLGRAWAADSRWRRVVREVALAGFSPAESREYLRRRGVVSEAVAQRILDMGGGSPLALSLAADLAVGAGAVRFPAPGQWSRVLGELCDQLLREVPNPQLRELLELGCVVRQFDAGLLEALAGRGVGQQDLERLAGLSVVEPSEHGLRVHEEVRELVLKRLDPAVLRRLQAQAAEWYRRRAAAAEAREREWLVAERLFLCGDRVVHQFVFPREPEAEAVYLDAVGAAEAPRLRQIWRVWVEQVTGAPPRAAMLRAVERLLAYPGLELRAVRDGSGNLEGFRGVLPVCRESLPLLWDHPAFGSLAHSLWSDASQLAPTPEESRSYHFTFSAFLPRLAGPVRAALVRDVFGSLAREGSYYVSTPAPEYKALLGVFGFRHLASLRNWAYGPRCSCDHYVLDLSRRGFDAWAEELVRRVSFS
ncbi:MAG: BTAD domain-containing putative transcriptional regulator [Thermaerobacter sp.]|nr:BTAD domain-containing putative transcriptional regulator [Thermaerobacter sp.]